MKAVFFVLILALSLSAGARPGDNPRRPGMSSGEQAALESARRNQQAELDRIIQREAARHRPENDRFQNCGRSFWKKAAALRHCPPATAMKVRSHDGTYYVCDCSED